MAISRYLSARGPIKGTKTMSIVNVLIRNGIKNGAIDTTDIVLEEDRRLDQIAGQYYGDASYWWVIASASGIGWGLQVPAGTIINIPKDLNQILSLVV